MKEELSIDIIGLAGACSYALDCIEAELVNIKNKHGKRVAYISICMAEYCTRSGGILKQATISRKPSGHFAVIWYEAARVLIIN